MATLLNVDDYEHAARERLEASIYDYIAGGSMEIASARHGQCGTPRAQRNYAGGYVESPHWHRTERIL